MLTGALDAVVGGGSEALGLGPARRVLVAVVDGLGSEALAARAGHARALRAAQEGGGRSRPMDTGCPTTTAAALTTLTTGTSPGVHGLVSYAVAAPAGGAVVNQLHGYDETGPPAGWQRARTVFERAAEAGVAAVATGPRHFADSAFTAAVLRGARYVGARRVEERFTAALDELRRAGRGVAYVYVPELDRTAHREGWASAAWTQDLEVVDGAVAAVARALGPGEALLVTADHGILDVPPSRHVVLEGTGLLDAGVRALAGEPRLLHVHLHEPAAAEATAARWAEVLGERADVGTRAEAVADGWYGQVDHAVLPRIGDVLVAARGRHACYASGDAPARGMVGQHGSWTDTERLVPLLRFGS